MTDVLVIAEHRRNRLRDVSLEMVSAGRDLVRETGGDLHVAVIGGNVERYADQLNVDGVGTVRTVNYGEEFNHDVYVQAVEQLCADLGPAVLLSPHTANGMDYVPAVSERLDIPLVTDAIGFAFDDGLTVTREMYGSKVETDVAVMADHCAVTVRPAEWATIQEAGDAEVLEFHPTLDETAIKTTVTGFEEIGGDDVDIANADFIISIGRGIEEEDNLALIEELVEVTGATLASSRPIVDSGWLPKNRQVGQSGKVVTPTVYLAIGISGAVQHVAGMKGSETIVAINTDPNAPIFDIADYGIVGDLFDVVPELIGAFS